jgi:hypothetical protein
LKRLGKSRLSHGRMQANVGALGGAQIQALCDRLYRECRFAPQPRRNHQLDWIALAPRQQIRLLAIESAQLFGKDALGLGLGRFQPQLPRVVLSDFAFCLKSR